MTLKIISKRVMLSELTSNSTVSFVFDVPVTPILFGLTAFCLQYEGNEGHNVGTMEVSASLGTISSDHKIVNLSLTGSMIDNGGNTVNVWASYVEYTVLGWNGTVGPVNMGTGALQASGNSYTLPSIPSNVITSAPVLGGFKAAYTDGDHQVMTVSATTTLNGTSVLLGGSMVDNKQHHSATVDIIGGEIVTTIPLPGFVMQTVSGLQVTGAGDTSTVDFSSYLPAGQQLTGCAAIMTGFTVSYPGGNAHDVSYISAGLAAGYFPGNTWPEITFDATNVILTMPSAIMNDRGSPNYHGQDNSLSSVSLLVIGLCG